MTRFDREISATAGKRSSFGALRALGINDDAPPCPYPRHRETDWRLRDGGGPVQCGVCHPAAPNVPALAVGQIERTR